MFTLARSNANANEPKARHRRARLEPLFHVDRELFVVTRAHETYYREELRDVDDSRIILQLLNRGTGVAVALALLHILQRDADAVVVFVPYDHYYSDAEACSRVIRLAISGAEQYSDSIVLVGAKACYPEVEYGWIELGSTISHAPIPLLRVNRFWEKPSLSQAQELLPRGCLWNTFVTVGHAKTFLDWSVHRFRTWFCPSARLWQKMNWTLRTG